MNVVHKVRNVRLWHECDVLECPLYSRFRCMTGHNWEIAELALSTKLRRIRSGSKIQTEISPPG
jgi:hypothetical protein